MALIRTAEERQSQKNGLKLVILGPSGIGKTSLVWTLDPDKTLVIDMEAGMLALEGWTGDSIDVRALAVEMGLHPWVLLQHLACLIAGPSPSALKDSDTYSRAHFEYATKLLGKRADVIGKYDTIFGDSLTQAGRFCFSWAKTQPEAFSEKTGKPDTRGAYGKHGQEMVGSSGMLCHLQHTPDKNIIMVGILEQKEDDYGRKRWTAQIDGSKVGQELPGIVDEVISMVQMPFGEPPVQHRVFVCQTMNPDGYPAKDRSGRLDMIEEPHLGKLIAKMTAGRRSQELTYGMPDASPTPPTAEPTPEVVPVANPSSADGGVVPVQAETAANPQDIPWMND